MLPEDTTEQDGEELTLEEVCINGGEFIKALSLNDQKKVCMYLLFVCFVCMYVCMYVCEHNVSLCMLHVMCYI